MRLIILGALLAVSAAAQAQTLNDKALLATDPGFRQRVQVAVVTTAILVGQEADNTQWHANRSLQAVNALLNQTLWTSYFVNAVPTDATVIAGATVNGTVALTTGNLAAQAALATDTAILNAVWAQWNDFFQH